MESEAEVIRRYLAEIGRKGGLSKSERKAAAVRNNGKKGGRPRKDQADKREAGHERL